MLHLAVSVCGCISIDFPPDTGSRNESQLSIRGVSSSGIVPDDIKTLQEIFDKEWKQGSADRERQARLARAAQKRAEEKRRQQLLAERRRTEDREAVRDDPDLQFWLALTRAERTPRDVQLRLASSTSVRVYCKYLATNRSVKSLDLCRCGLGDDVGKRIGAMLARNDGLLSLDLTDNRLGPSSLVSIANGLRENRTLRSLTLAGNPLTQGGTDFRGVEALEDALRVNGALAAVSLARCKVGADGGAALAAALDVNSSLLQVELDGADGVLLVHQRAIRLGLKRNLAAVRAAQEEARRARGQERRRAEAAEKAARELEEEASKARWLSAQREERERKRKEEKEDRIKADAEAKARREAAELKRIAEIKAAGEKKKKKGKKKKK